MNHIVSKHLLEDLKTLQQKKETAHQAFLDALTYVKPFEEVKKLYQEFRSAESELNTLQTMLQLNIVPLS